MKSTEGEALWVLKIVLTNNNSLCRYFQQKTVVVISTRRNANMTIQRLDSNTGVGSEWFPVQPLC